MKFSLLILFSAFIGFAQESGSPQSNPQNRAPGTTQSAFVPLNECYGTVDLIPETSTSGAGPLTVTFRSSSNCFNDFLFAKAPSACPVSLSFDPGDGSGFDPVGSSSIWSHTYSSPGTYTAQLVLSCGNSLKISQETITVSNGCVEYGYVTEDLTSNRYNGLPANTLQVVAFHTGSGTAQLKVEAYDSQLGCNSWLVLDAPRFTTKIATGEYDITGLTLTGRVKIENIVYDGAVDGLAFSLFWRDASSRYHLVRSNDSQALSGATYISIWPLGMYDAQFLGMTPQLTDAFARQAARASIYGAKLMTEGTHTLVSPAF